MNRLLVICMPLMMSIAALAVDDTPSSAPGGDIRTVTRFVTPDDAPLRLNTETTGNNKDKGVFRWLISKETGSGDIELGIGWLEPGEVHLLHHHTNSSEFYYILKGSATITSGDEVKRVFPGTAVYIPAGDSHKIVSDGEETLEMLFGYPRPDRETVFDE